MSESKFIQFKVCVCAQSLSRVQLFLTPWTVACEAALSVEFCMQEYWSGLPFPSPGIFPTPGSNPHLLNYRWILHHCATWEAMVYTRIQILILFSLLPKIRVTVFPTQKRRQPHTCSCSPPAGKKLPTVLFKTLG